jgi:hypothetical protein
MNWRARQTTVAFTLAAASLWACNNPPADGNPVAPATPAASVAPAASQTTSATASAAPTPVAPKLATSKINGKILNDVEMTDISAALKKAGWTDKGGSGMAIGATKTVVVNAEKDGMKAKATLIKPTGATTETGSGIKMASAQDQTASYEAKGAALLDGDVLFAIEIDGKKDEAKKLLDSLIEK